MGRQINREIVWGGSSELSINPVNGPVRDKEMSELLAEDVAVFSAEVRLSIEKAFAGKPSEIARFLDRCDSFETQLRAAVEVGSLPLTMAVYRSYEGLIREVTATGFKRDELSLEMKKFKAALEQL